MISDEEQIRAWCVDYALQLGKSKTRLTPQRVIADAKVIEQYITNRPLCEITLLQQKPNCQP